MKKTKLLIVGGDNKLLSTSIAFGLKTTSTFDSVILIESVDEAESKGFFSIVVALASHPITSFIPKLLKLGNNGTKILLVLSPNDIFAFHYIFTLPLHGLLSSDASFDELLAAISAVGNRGLKYISPGLVSAATSRNYQASPFSHLSKKELEVVIGMIDGKRNSEIAKELNISEKTVSTYRARVFKKLSVRNSAQLFNQAYRSGMIFNNNRRG